MKPLFCLAAALGVLALVLPAGAEQAPESTPVPGVPSSTTGDSPKIDTGEFLPSMPPLPATSDLPVLRQMPSAEQLEQLKKDRNWLVEGMKEKERQDESQPASSLSSEDMSQSIIEMVLRKQQSNVLSAQEASAQRALELETSRTPPAPGTRPVFQPSISTSAFDPLPTETSDSSLRPMNVESILARERDLAEQTPAYTSLSASAPQRDPLANPFGNLPIPEGVLPRSNRLEGASSINDPMLQNAWTNPGSSAPVFNANPAISFPGMGSQALILNDIGAPGAPGAAIAQPYDYLRAQEEQRRRQQFNSNRPQLRDLRSPVPSPSEARLF